MTGALVQQGVLSVYALMLLNQSETTHLFKVLCDYVFLPMGCWISFSNEIPRKKGCVQLHLILISNLTVTYYKSHANFMLAF